MATQTVYDREGNYITFATRFRSLLRGIGRKMGGINLNAGSVNLGNVIAMIAVAALVWFGSTMTNDHEQIIKILDGQAGVLQAVNDMKSEVVDVKGLMAGFQRNLAENQARLDCIQGVGTVEGCSANMIVRPLNPALRRHSGN